MSELKGEDDVRNEVRGRSDIKRKPRIKCEMVRIFLLISHCNLIF